MNSPKRFVLAALPLLAVAACDVTAPEPDASDEFESLDLGEVTSEIVLGTLPYDTPFKTKLYPVGAYAYHFYFLDTRPGDSLNLVAEFNGARGFVSFAKVVGRNRATLNVCPDSFPNGCQSLQVTDNAQYLVYATTARFRFEGIPTAADYKIEVVEAVKPPDPPPAFCGVRGGVECGEGEFCNFPPESICGAADGPGFCEPIPTACIELFAPVESCDGTVYCNSCYAAAWSASVIGSAGPTDPSEIVCSFPDDGNESPFPGDKSCSTDNPCADFEVCDYSGLELDECPESYDGLTGICRNPALSTCPAEPDEVCGCDGVTYRNTCLLGLSTGVAIAYPGACE